MSAQVFVTGAAFFAAFAGAAFFTGAFFTEDVATAVFFAAFLAGAAFVTAIRFPLSARTGSSFRGLRRRENYRPENPLLMAADYCATPRCASNHAVISGAIPIADYSTPPNLR